MVDAKQQAAAIYETICASSADRPLAGQSVEQITRDIAKWQSGNPGLILLREATAEVQAAFLSQSVGWLGAESKKLRNFRTVFTLVDGIQHTLSTLSRPFSTDLIEMLLSQLRENHWVRMYFPFGQLLSLVHREQVSEKIRAELGHVRLLYAPSPKGKIDQHSLEIARRIDELLHVEGDRGPDPGRGPWSQIVFNEISAKDDITRSGWHALLEHCKALESPHREMEEAVTRINFGAE